MVAIHHRLSQATLWVTEDHRLLSKPRPRTLGGNNDWSAIPTVMHARRRELRNNATSAERRLWTALRGEQTGYKFRRQHSVGPYIADFYSREVQLVVEVDGPSHFTSQGVEHDMERDRYFHELGLEVLHVTNDEVRNNLDGVLVSIQEKCQQKPSHNEDSLWHEAGELKRGDQVYYGIQQTAVGIGSPAYEQVEDEKVYDLTVEGTHSFLTETCMVHNCGELTVKLNNHYGDELTKLYTLEALSP
jgi:adenine-specific DNA-methyltransferase